MKYLIAALIVLYLVCPITATALPMVMDNIVTDFDREGIVKSLFFIGPKSWLTWQHEFDPGMYTDPTLTIETTALTCPHVNYYVAAIIHEDEFQWAWGKAGDPLDMVVPSGFLDDGVMNVYVRGFLGMFEVNQSTLTAFREREPVPTPTPEPATLFLLGSAILMFPLMRRNKLIKKGE